MTKTFPLEALSFLALRTPSLFVAVLFPYSVGGIRCLEVNSVVEVSVATSLGREVVCRSVVNVLVEIFLKRIVVVSFFFMNSVVVSLLVVPEFVCGIVDACEDIAVVRRVSLLLVLDVMVEVVVTTVCEEVEDACSIIIYTHCRLIFIMLVKQAKWAT